MWLPVTTAAACGSLPSRRSQRLAAASTDTLAPISLAQPISSRRAWRSSSVRQARSTPSPAMAPNLAIAISRSHCRCSLTAATAWCIRIPLATARSMQPMTVGAKGWDISGHEAGTSHARRCPRGATQRTRTACRELWFRCDLARRRAVLSRGGEAIAFRDGRLSFKPIRADIPIHIASNGPLGQRTAGAVADGAIMEACGSVAEALALAAEVRRGAKSAGRDAGSVRLTARLNACIAADGGRARDIVRPSVARYLGRGTLKLATAEAQGLTLPPEATAPLVTAPYAAGVRPYLPLLPLITDRHVDALALAGSKAQVTARVIELRKAGIDAIIVRPVAGEGVSAEDTIAAFGEIWPANSEQNCERRA